MVSGTHLVYTRYIPMSAIYQEYAMEKPLHICFLPVILMDGPHIYLYEATISFTYDRHMWGPSSNVTGICFAYDRYMLGASSNRKLMYGGFPMAYTGYIADIGIYLVYTWYIPETTVYLAYAKYISYFLPGICHKQ